MGTSLSGSRIVVGVCGGIAAYKSLDVISQLRKRGAQVFVIASAHALSLIDEEELKKASGNEVRSSLFERGIDYRSYLKNNRPIPHMSLADSADLILLCPATANIIGKIANGICDDLLTTTVCATDAAIIVCPAMNVKMWNNPIVQKNVGVLRNAQYHIVGPEYGELACGYKGMGRLSSSEPILEMVETVLLEKNSLKGVRIVVTAGGTQEPIDAVRVITNRSSGKMGVRIAEAAHMRGAEVTLIRSVSAIEPIYPMSSIAIRSANDLKEALKKEAKKADIIVHAAAVSDFTIAPKKEKIKSGVRMNLELEPTTKILERIKEWNSETFVVGFKAEYDVGKDELISRAKRLLRDARADMIVANDIGKSEGGFDSENNEVFMVSKKGAIHLPLQKKSGIAKKILEEIRKRTR